MRRIVSTVIAAAFVVGMIAPVFAAEKTLKGELVDQACYLKDKSMGADHQKCAMDCAKKGQTVALLTDDGLYAVTGDLAANKNEKLVPHMSHIVELTGDVSEKDGKKMIETNAKSLKMVAKAK